MKTKLNAVFFLPWFLLGVPLFLVVHLELLFGELYTFDLVWKPVLFLFVCPLLLFAIFWFFVRHFRRAALMAFITTIFIFFLSEWKYYLMLNAPGSLFSKYIFLLPFSGIVLGIGYFFIWRSKKEYTAIVRYLNLIFFLFIVYDAGQLLWKKLYHKMDAGNAFDFSNTCAGCTKPNIYYIVLDGYSAASVLQKDFGFNNDSIANWLTGNGFKMIDSSKSNYNITSYSLASTFNMQYSREVNKDVFLLKDYVNGIKEFYHNGLMPGMKKAGYKVGNLSFLRAKGIAGNAPRFDLFNMEHLFNKYNLFYQIYTDMGFHFADKLWSSETEMQKFALQKDAYTPALLDNLKKILQARDTQPMFNYIHYYTPHAPYTRDALGNRRESFAANPLTEAQEYVDQVQYTNKLIRETVTEIMEKDPNEKIIILQGDHGFRFDVPEKYKDEFPNFSAVYFTKKELLQQIPVNMNNVNTFRYIGNLFFGKQLPILEPKQFALKYRIKAFH